MLLSLILLVGLQVKEVFQRHVITANFILEIRRILKFVNS